MKRRKSVLFGILGLSILALFIFGCSGSQNDETTVEEKALSVRGTLAENSNQELFRSFTGTLEGSKQAVITAKIAEAVEDILVKEGDYVKEGEVLVKLDKTGASSQYVQAHSVYVNAEKNYNKMKYLFEQGAVSESEFDNAETSYKVAKANFESAGKLVQLVSPIDGIVTLVDVSVGDYLYSGQKVATVASTKTLRMYLGVSEKDIGYFKVGEKVKVTVESKENQSGTGRVAAVASSADPVTRTFQVELEVDNNSSGLMPGTFAKAEILVEHMEDIIVIPRSAAVNRNDKFIAFKVNGDHVKAVDVELGTAFNGNIQIISGINPGDTVVTVGQNYLADGYKVKLVSLSDIDGKEITQ